MQALWVELATEWWEARQQDGDGVQRWDAAVKALFLKQRLALQIEALLCEAANRQLRARACAAERKKGRKVRGTKGAWKAVAPHKDLTSVTALHIGPDKTVVRSAKLNLKPAEAAASSRAAGKRPCRR